MPLPTTEAELAAYLTEKRLRPVPGNEPRLPARPTLRTQAIPALPIAPQTTDPYPLIQIALRLIPDKNKGTWQGKHARIKKQRLVTYQYCTQYWKPVPPLPLTITLTRLSPGTLDDDSLLLAASPCRDGVADWLCGELGHGEDRLEGLTWKYAQTHAGPGYFAVRIELEREHTCSPPTRPNAS